VDLWAPGEGGEERFLKKILLNPELTTPHLN